MTPVVSPVEPAGFEICRGASLRKTQTSTSDAGSPVGLAVCDGPSGPWRVASHCVTPLSVVPTARTSSAVLPSPRTSGSDATELQWPAGLSVAGRTSSTSSEHAATAVSVLAAFLAVSVAGCTGDDSPAAAPTSAAPAADVEHARTLLIITEDHTYGSRPTPYRRVLVVDAPMQGEGFTADVPGAVELFSAGLQADLRAALADLPSLDFVSVADATADLYRDRPVAGPGAVVTVGRIIEAGSQVQVSHKLRCGPKCGQLMTYVVERRGDSWVVTGTTGASVIS